MYKINDYMTIIYTTLIEKVCLYKNKRKITTVNYLITK